MRSIDTRKRGFPAPKGGAVAAVLAVALASGLLAAACAASPKPRGGIDWDSSERKTASLGALDGASWDSDLAYLASELQARHPNPWHSISRKDFEALLRSPAPGGLGPEDLAEARGAAVARALAAMGEAHTKLVPLAELDRVLPIGLSRGSDGFYVVAIGGLSGDSPELDLLGHRITFVNGRPAAEAFAALAPYASAENELALQEEEASIFQRAGILVAAGLSRSGDASVRIAVDSGGATVERELAFLRSSSRAYQAQRFVDCFQRSGVAPAFSIGKSEAYWYRYLPGSKTMFFQYNSCQNMKKQSFEAFCAELFAAIDKERPERLVVDLRNNGGGDSSLFTYRFMPRLRSSYLKEKGRLLALVGPRVLSSGIFAANELRQAGAIFVGESTGEGPTHYGYIGYFALPRSGLAIMHATHLWTLVPGDDSREMEVDLRVGKDMPALMAGRDPCLEAALAYGR